MKGPKVLLYLFTNSMHAPTTTALLLAVCVAVFPLAARAAVAADEVWFGLTATCLEPNPLPSQITTMPLLPTPLPSKIYSG